MLWSPPPRGEPTLPLKGTGLHIALSDRRGQFGAHQFQAARGLRRTRPGFAQIGFRAGQSGFGISRIKLYENLTSLHPSARAQII